MATKGEVLTLKVVVDTKTGEASLDKITKKVKTTAEETTKASKSMVSGFNALKTSIVALGIGAALRSMDILITKAGEISALHRGFDTLTGSINESADMMLGKMRQAAHGFITDAELMRLANNAIILGLPITADRMAVLTEGAIKLGRAMGVDATRSLESLRASADSHG